VLDAFPTECNLADAQQDLIRGILSLKWIVVRAVVDELRAEGTRWPEIRSRRDQLLNDDDALFAEFISRFGRSVDDESTIEDDSTGGDAVDPCA